MTVLVGWIPSELVGDKYLATSAYIAADSRITQKSFKPLDLGQKVFCCQNDPSILGFCGDVIAGTALIKHVVSVLDNGWVKDDSVEAGFSKVFELIKRDGVLDRPVTILHIRRRGRRLFGICKYVLREGCWTMEIQANTPSSSSPRVIVTGTGREEFLDKMCEFSKGNSASTSRNVFQVLCSMIQSVRTPTCGGAIQLVGLYSQGIAHPYGYVHDGTIWVYGHKLPPELIPANLELRNNLFERCDPKTLKLMDGAQAQPNELM